MNQPINILFDGPPGAIAGRFVEVELDDGSGVNAGEWIHRPDGLWALRITELPPAPARTSRESARCAGSGTLTNERGVIECPVCSRLVRVRDRNNIPSHGTLVTRNVEANQERLRWAREIEQRKAEHAGQ